MARPTKCVIVTYSPGKIIRSSVYPSKSWALSVAKSFKSLKWEIEEIKDETRESNQTKVEVQVSD